MADRNIEGSFSSRPENEVLIESAAAVEDLAAATSSALNIASEAAIMGVNIYSSLDTSQYEALGNAAGSAATEYLQRKLDRIRNLWNTNVDVSIKSLVGEAAPYAVRKEDISSNLSRRIASVMRYLSGSQSSSSDSENIWSDIARDIGMDALDYFRSDPSLMNTVNSLSAVQAFANYYNMSVQISSVVKRIKSIYSRISSIQRIASNISLSFWSGGSSAALAATESAEESEKQIGILNILLMYAIKRMIFPITIPIPKLLVEAYGNLSVRDSMIDISGENGWLSSFFNDEFYGDMLNTGLAERTITRALESIKETFSSAESNWEIIQKSMGLLNEGMRTGTFYSGMSRGDVMTALFRERFTSDYMREISANSRKVAHIYDYSDTSYYNKGSSEILLRKSLPSSDTVDSMGESGFSRKGYEYRFNDDSRENPIVNMESLRKVSRELYNNL